MKTIIKNIIKEIVPNIFLRCFRYVKLLILHNSTKEDISTFNKNHHVQLFEESIILGNGPSLKHTLTNHLSFFDNKNVFCLNFFVESEAFMTLKPKFYVFADPAFWSKNCSPKLSAQISKISEQLKEKVSWQMYLFLPSTARGWNYFQESLESNNNITLIYYNINPSTEILHKRHLLYKENKAMVQAQTVLIAAIFISLNLGVKTNYVVGGDLSMHEVLFVNKENIVHFYHKHFYDKEEVDASPFWRNPEQISTFRMDELLLAFSLMFKGFWELEEYSKFLGAKIYNASHKTFIDAFERYDFES